MKSPVFSEIRAKMMFVKEELEKSGSLQDHMKNFERTAAQICAENKEALVSAWVAETGLLPSQSVICSGFTPDGQWRCFVESKEENDKRARVPVFREEMP